MSSLHNLFWVSSTKSQNIAFYEKKPEGSFQDIRP